MSSRSLSFLDLPTELRVLVYERLFDDKNQLKVCHPLRCVSRKVHDEVTPLMLRRLRLTVKQGGRRDKTIYSVGVPSWACQIDHSRQRFITSLLAPWVEYFGEINFLHSNCTKLCYTLRKRLGDPADVHFLRNRRELPWEVLNEAKILFEARYDPRVLKIRSLSDIDDVMAHAKTCGKEAMHTDPSYLKCDLLALDDSCSHEELVRILFLQFHLDLLIQHFKIILLEMELSEPSFLQLPPELDVLVLGYLLDDPSHCSLEHSIRKVCKTLHDKATVELFRRKHVNMCFSPDGTSHGSVWSPESYGPAFILLRSLRFPQQFSKVSWTSFCTSRLAPFLSHAEQTTVVYWDEHGFEVRIGQRRNVKSRLLSSKIKTFLHNPLTQLSNLRPLFCFVNSASDRFLLK
ncbi:hypothetical protein E4T43_04723 [Aureobasidium subglaciale]|nr:hypothetical protein E4T43_04723 [Aureobasidium subglaciale]